MALYTLAPTVGEVTLILDYAASSSQDWVYQVMSGMIPEAKADNLHCRQIETSPP
jgi:hypothetical protein